MKPVALSSAPRTEASSQAIHYHDDLARPAGDDRFAIRRPVAREHEAQTERGHEHGPESPLVGRARQPQRHDPATNRTKGASAPTKPPWNLTCRSRLCTGAEPSASSVMRSRACWRFRCRSTPGPSRYKLFRREARMGAARCGSPCRPAQRQGLRSESPRPCDTRQRLGYHRPARSRLAASPSRRSGVRKLMDPVLREGTHS